MPAMIELQNDQPLTGSISSKPGLWIERGGLPDNGFGWIKLYLVFEID